MGYSAILWLLISLTSISLTSNHPVWALALAGGGGFGLGVYLWRQAGVRTVSVRPSEHWPSWVYRYELLLLGPALLVLLFANRLPVVLVLVALGWLLLLAVGRKVVRGRFTVGTPLDLPLLLLLIPSLTSLYAAMNLRESGQAVCMLMAGMVFGYLLIDLLDTERKIHRAFLLFLAVGVWVALSSFLVMRTRSKLPLVDSLFGGLPGYVVDWLHPNYMGGALAFFLPAAFWGCVLGYRFRVWTGIATLLIGSGLLLTQSRSALLSVGAAIVLTGACWNRWVRWLLPVLALAIGLIVYGFGAEVFLDPLPSDEVERSLAGRQELWQRAVFIAQDFPFTGIGLRSFPVVVELLYPTFLSASPGPGPPHAHNLYLEIVAALGFPGLVAFSALLGAWGGMVGELLIRARRNPELRIQGIVVLGFASGMVAHLLYGITDAIALGEKAGVVFWALIGLTGAAWKRARLGEWPNV